MAKPTLKKGDDVTWAWGTGKGQGKVTKVIETDVTETIKGAKVTRHASPETPAAEVKTAKGGRVLKSTTELKKK